jgi:periplasmic protein CpxP/Spy
MKTWMKTTLAASLIAMTGLGAGTALARGGDCGYGMQGGKAGMQRMAPEQMQERMTQRADLQLARLELALALTPQQQPAWTAFKGAMTERSARMGAEMAKRMQQPTPQTAIERRQRMEEMGALHQAELAESRKAVERFYATLSETQKKVFDADFRVMGRMGGKGGHGMGPGRDGGPREGRAGQARG